MTDRQPSHMDLSYFIKAPISQTAAKLLDRSHRMIPSEHKGIFVTLFFIIFATITGVGIVVPLLPLYAHDLGAKGIYVAMIFGAFSISRTVLLPVLGRWSDQKGRKPFIIAGLVAYILISLAFAWTTTVEGLIFIRFIQGAGSAMIVPVVQAYVGEITPEGTEGWSMGLFNLSMFLSLSIGPFIGGAVLDYWSMAGAFYCMGALSLAGLILCLIFLPPLSQEKIRKKKHRKTVPYAMLIRDTELIGLWVFRYAYTACIGIIWCFLPLYADTAFHISGTKIGLLVMMGVFVSGLLQLPMGYAADRFNKKIMVMTGGCLCILGIICPLWASSFNDLLISVFIFGIGGGIAMPAISAMAVIKGDQKHAMGAVMSLLTVAHSMGMLTGSLLAGLSMDFFSLSYAFPCGFLIMVTCTIAFPILFRQTPDATEPTRIGQN